MADVKISAMGAAAALGGGEAIPAVQAGGNVRLSPAQLMNYGGAGRGYAGPSDPGPTNDAALGYAAGSGWLNTATGVRWTCLDASAGAALWAAGGASDHPGYVSGHFYPAQRGSSSSGTAAADTLVASPIYLAQRVAVAALGVRVLTGVAATAVLLGLYGNAGANPGTMIAAGSGSAATTVSGADAVCSFASAVTLAPGIYWIASLFNGAPAVSCIPQGDQMLSSLLGFTNMGGVAGTTFQIVGVTGAGATFAGGLPASFGAATRRTGNNYTPLGCIRTA